jgi:hypothetical protein
MDINKRNRTELKSYFVKNAIPTESNFADLIEGALNQKDDGIVKLPGDPLCIEASGDATSLKKCVNFYRNFSDANPDWTMTLNPRSNPADAATARLGFNIGDGDGNSRLFIDRNNGNVGIGTLSPKGFHVALPESAKGGVAPGPGVTIAGGPQGNASIELRNNGSGTPYIDFAVDGASDFDARLRLVAKTQFAIEGVNVGIGTASIYNPQGWNKTVDILGTGHTRLNVRTEGGVVTSIFSHDTWSGARGVIGTDSNHPLTLATAYTHRMTIDTAGNVGIGTATPGAKLEVAGGAIRPAAGNSETAGIMFPKDPGGGGGDAAWIRYYPRQGEQTTFEIGTANDGDDHIALMPTGNVGVGITDPGCKLTVSAASTHLQLRREATATTGGKQLFLELFQVDPSTRVPEVYPSIRFHHNNRFWHRIEARGNGLHFKNGDLNSDGYVDITAARISSALWKATRLFDRRSGPLPVEAQFSSSGGTLVIFTSGTGFKSSGGFMSLHLTLDGGSDRWTDLYANEANSHKPFPTTVEIFSGVAAGNHTFRIAVWSNSMVTDTNDRFYATVLELPF